MKKLTDEELSRVLSQQAIGKLIHRTYGDLDSGCGCIAGAVFALGHGFYGTSHYEENRAAMISLAAIPSCGASYPSTPESLLAYLANRGLV